MKLGTVLSDLPTPLSERGKIESHKRCLANGHPASGRRQIMNDLRPLYDRELLLLGAKRNVVLDLWEVQRYGSDSYGDTDYVSIYGMRPANWHAKGVRFLGRTAVECTRDRLGDAV